jgi:mannose-6-phosphate isomerase-like protein (cupin superfamily)
VESFPVTGPIIQAGVRRPPLQVHHFDETFYVLEGELASQVEQDLITKRLGEFAFVTLRVLHALANRSGTPPGYLLICTPAGFDRSYARRAAEQYGVEPPPWGFRRSPEVVGLGPRIGERPDEPKEDRGGGSGERTQRSNEPRKHPLSGIAADVPYVALPPAGRCDGDEAAPLIVAWHLNDPPAARPPWPPCESVARAVHELIAQTPTRRRARGRQRGRARLRELRSAASSAGRPPGPGAPAVTDRQGR